jgi:hypothetical protein
VTYPPQDNYPGSPYGSAPPSYQPPAPGGYPPPEYPQPEYPQPEYQQQEYTQTGYPPPGYPPPAPGGYPPAPQWPGQPAPTPSRGALPWILVGAGALVLVLIVGVVAVAVHLAGSTSRHPGALANPGATHIGPPGATDVPTLGGPTTEAPTSSAPAGPAYKVDTDLCGKLTYGPLGDWTITKERSDAPRKHGTGLADSYEVDCRDEFKNGKPGRFSSVDVRAQIYGSVDDAQEGYKISQDVDRSRFDKELTGYGDQAYGTYRTWTPGFNTSDYSVVTRSGNLVLSVHVSVSQESFIPKETMLTRVGPAAKAIMGLIPKA